MSTANTEMAMRAGGNARAIVNNAGVQKELGPRPRRIGCRLRVLVPGLSHQRGQHASAGDVVEV